VVDELLALKAQLRQAGFPRRMLAALEDEPGLPIVRADRGTNALYIGRTEGGDLLATYSTPSGAYPVATVERVLHHRPEYNAGAPGHRQPLRERHVSCLVTATEHDDWRHALAGSGHATMSDFIRAAVRSYLTHL
jgi:hypothetical protein